MFRPEDIARALAAPRGTNTAEFSEFGARLNSHVSLRLGMENGILLAKVRSVIPPEILSEANTEQKVRKLLTFFKRDFMRPFVTLMNCEQCQGPTNAVGSVAPTAEERLHLAGVVELHECRICRHQTRFPRYNSMFKVLETRLGRCGEWAQLFTVFLRACSIEARLVLDWTDHLWSEAKVGSRWVHCDPCEEAFDSPLMYETGWGKKLSYVFAYDRHSVVDVIRRYTNQYAEVQSRRPFDENAVAQLVDAIMLRLSGPRPDALLRELQVEKHELTNLGQKGRGLQQSELQGRITGDVEWRKARGELGNSNKEALLPMIFDGGAPSKAQDRLMKHAEQLHMTGLELERFRSIFRSINLRVTLSDWEFLNQTALSWPKDLVFPLLDTIRYASLTLEKGEIVDGSELLAFAINGFPSQEQQQQEKVLETNRFLAMQALANLIAKRSIASDLAAMILQECAISIGTCAHVGERSNAAMDALIRNIQIVYPETKSELDLSYLRRK